MHDIKTIEANGLQFAYIEAGHGDKLVLCLHGFPDNAHTWAALIPVLADAGYRVIAPFLRGYPPTEIPADGAYANTDLAADAIGLIDAFGAESAILIGHDWGASVAYAATALAPDRVAKLITVGIPHPRAIKLDLPQLIKARHFIGFQQRQSAVKWLSRNNYANIRTIIKRWSPSWNISDDELATIKATFSQTGAVESALGYYWSYSANRDNPDAHALSGARTSVPTLCVLGDADGALSMSALSRTKDAYTGRYEEVVLSGVGHFPHREAPTRFADLVLGFLND